MRRRMNLCLRHAALSTILLGIVATAVAPEKSAQAGSQQAGASQIDTADATAPEPSDSQAPARGTDPSTTDQAAPVAANDSPESTTASGTAAPATTATSNAVPVPGKLRPGSKEGQVQVMAAVLAFCGVVLAGVMLILGVLWWSRRQRRILLKPLPKQSENPPFWFLKADKPNVPADESSKTDE